MSLPISVEQQQAAARARGYKLFADALEYPHEAQTDKIRSGAFADGLEACFALLDAERQADLQRAALCDAGEHDTLAAEYTRLFDVGASKPPCPLYGGFYGGSRMKIMEEAVRFYDYFGLKLSAEIREMPDQLATQLEFLHYLAFCQAEALARGDDPGPYRRAEQDFLQRHPGRWVPIMRQRLDKQQPMPFFREIVRQLDHFLADASGPPSLS